MHSSKKNNDSAGKHGDPNAGFSCGKLIEQLRMQLASELLEHSKEPVEEIAFRCGYNDPFTFSRAFKRVMGHSPARHRSGS